MPKNYLLVYSEQLATEVELLCQNIKAPSNTIFQIRKSSSSVYANIREANYGQSRAYMLSKFEQTQKQLFKHNEEENRNKLKYASDNNKYMKYGMHVFVFFSYAICHSADSV